MDFNVASDDPCRMVSGSWFHKWVKFVVHSLLAFVFTLCMSIVFVTFFQLELVVKWEMHDQDDKVVYCWELPVKIVSGEDDLVEM